MEWSARCVSVRSVSVSERSVSVRGMMSVSERSESGVECEECECE